MTFYLKYRSQTIEELDITSVREQLQKIVKSGEIPHAFLFCGPKGTGKTSAARILAKVINCEEKKVPCNKCSQCKSIINGTNIDVVEMDAASNRGIDDIRALRDVVKLAPSRAKAKVYIIDEAHMLTTEASNALLKTLEEPPNHVYFILATTNPEKLIETIRSRTTMVTFTKATNNEIARALKRVTDGEKIKISAEEIAKIAKIAKGSFRDAVKLLEQFSKDNDYLKNLKVFDCDSFLISLTQKDINSALTQISMACKEGVGAESLTESILETLREELLSLSGIGGKAKYGLEQKELIQLIELIIKSKEDIKISPIEELPLELAIIKWASFEKPLKEEKKNDKPDKNNGENGVKDNIELKVETSETEIINIEVEEGRVDENSWKKILTEIKPINSTIEALLRTSKILVCDGKNIKLAVYYKFHKDKLEELKTKKLLEDAAERVFQRPVRMECLVTNPPPKELPKIQLTESNDQGIVKVAEEIFNV